MDIIKYNKFNMPDDLFIEQTFGFLCGSFICVPCANSEGRFSSDLGIPLSLFNWNFREFLLFIFLYNNKDLVKEVQWKEILNMSNIKNLDRKQFKDIWLMDKDEFIVICSFFISAILNYYISIAPEELERQLIEAGICTDTFRFKEGIDVFYKYHMRLFYNLIYDKDDETKLHDVYTRLLPLLDISGFELMDSLTDFNKKYNVDINIADEDNDIIRIIMFKLFINFVATFHNTLKEISDSSLPSFAIDNNKYRGLTWLGDLIKKLGFNNEDDLATRVEKSVGMLLNDRTGKPKLILDVINTASPYLLNTNFPYYNDIEMTLEMPK